MQTKSVICLSCVVSTFCFSINFCLSQGTFSIYHSTMIQQNMNECSEKIKGLVIFINETLQAHLKEVPAAIA